MYDPMEQGAVIAIHVWLEDGYQPMAELAFAFGGTKVIQWDNVYARDEYAPGINAYTIIYDDRSKWHPFEKMVKVPQ